MATHHKRELRTAIPGPISKALHDRKSSAVSPGVGVTLPAYIASASDGFLEDVDGNVLIDLASGIGVTGVGNSNKDVIKAVQDQVEKFTHTAFAVTPYESYVRVCELLNEVTPGDFPKLSALFNSGAEAVENAVKIARKFTGRSAIVVLENGYHGRTNLTMGMTAKTMPFKLGFGPFAPEVYRMPTSYPLRDRLGGREVAKEVLTRIEKEIGGSALAAIVVEPVQGEGGFIIPADGFLSALQQFCHQSGAVFIADEIQSGFCRTGAWFASEHHELVPDLIITAKGIAGGMPLSAVTGKSEIMESIHPGGLGGTYTGNPAACAAAEAAIGWMRTHDAVALARKIQSVFFETLSGLKEKHPEVIEVRGLGAMLAVEFGDPNTHEPLPEFATKVAKYCHENGVVVLVTGIYGNVVRFLPPLSIPESVFVEGLGVFQEAVTLNAS